MKVGKKNKVSLNLLHYNVALIGQAGIGKTTIMKEYCERLAGEDGYLFLECGKEDGNDAINGLNYVSVIDWDSDYDEEENTIGFETLIDDIVNNRTSDDWKDLKVIVVDTIDELFNIADQETIEMHNHDNPNKKVKSINAAFGGYGHGQDKTIEILIDKLWSLKRVGVSFCVIGHVKNRNVEDVETGDDYQVLTTNISQKYFNAIKTKMHFLGVASIDREIVSQKTNKKDFATKKDITRNVVKSETRKITFRDDNYNIDSKSRFADIVGSIPFNVDDFIKAMQDAVNKEYAKSGKDIQIGLEEQKKEEEAKFERVAEAEQKKNEKKAIDDVINKIIEFFTENKSNLDKIKPILNKVKELGYSNPKEITSLDDAKTVLAMTTA